MDFGGFYSAEKTLPSPPFSPALDISSPFEIHLHLQRHFPVILFRRNIRFTEALRICSVREHSREVLRSRSLRNPYIAKFDDPTTDECQGTKDFLAWQNLYSLLSLYMLCLHSSVYQS